MYIEPIDVLNRRLIDRWGRCFNDQPYYRISFSDEQFEKRFDEWVDKTREGIYLRTVREVREVPKYPFIQGKYILEKLFEVPLIQQGEILAQLSYECIYVFEDTSGNPVAPVWVGIELILNTVTSVQETGKYYQDPDMVDPEFAQERKEQKIKEIQEALFGNETDTGDALRYKEAIVVPRNFEGKVN